MSGQELFPELPPVVVGVVCCYLAGLGTPEHAHDKNRLCSAAYFRRAPRPGSHQQPGYLLSCAAHVCAGARCLRSRCTACCTSCEWTPIGCCRASHRPCASSLRCALRAAPSWQKYCWVSHPPSRAAAGVRFRPVLGPGRLQCQPRPERLLAQARPARAPQAAGRLGLKAGAGIEHLQWMQAGPKAGAGAGRAPAGRAALPGCGPPQGCALRGRAPACQASRSCLRPAPGTPQATAGRGRAATSATAAAWLQAPAHVTWTCVPQRFCRWHARSSS